MDVAQPAFPHRLAHEVEAGIVAEHIPHLDDEVLLLGLREQRPPDGEVRARRFVEMNVLTGIDGFLTQRQQLGYLALDRDHLNSGVVEDFCFFEPLQVLPVSLLLPLLAPGSVRFADADEFPLRKVAQHVELALRMRMTGAEHGAANWSHGLITSLSFCPLLCFAVSILGV